MSQFVLTPAAEGDLLKIIEYLSKVTIPVPS